MGGSGSGRSGRCDSREKKDISHPVDTSGHLFEDYRDGTTTVSSCSKRVNRCICCLYICMLDANGTRATNWGVPFYTPICVLRERFMTVVRRSPDLSLELIIALNIVHLYRVRLVVWFVPV